jgi:hypothetical protein
MKGDRVRALLLLVVVLLVSPAVSEERVWRLGVLTPGDWTESSVRQVMVPELARRDFVEGRVNDPVTDGVAKSLSRGIAAAAPIWKNDDIAPSLR